MNGEGTAADERGDCELAHDCALLCVRCLDNFAWILSLQDEELWQTFVRRRAQRSVAARRFMLTDPSFAGDRFIWSLEDCCQAACQYEKLPAAAKRAYTSARVKLAGKPYQLFDLSAPSAHGAVMRMAQFVNLRITLRFCPDPERWDSPRHVSRHASIPSIETVATHFSGSGLAERPIEVERQLEAAEAHIEQEYALVMQQPPGNNLDAVATQQPLAGPGSVDCYVTLLQMAAMVNRSKKTLEGYRDRDELPPPDIEGGGSGRPNEWRWETVRPWLETTFGRSLPPVFPADRFRRS